MTSERAPADPLPHALREYAFIADSLRGALIGPRGDLSFMCAPSFESDAVFSALVGGKGSFVVAPADPFFVWGGYYEDHSLIFKSRWITSSGVVECLEAMALPADEHTAVVLRRVTAVDTPVRLDVRFDPRAGFGRSGLRQLSLGDGVWAGRSGALQVRLSGLAGGRHSAAEGIVGEVSLRSGESHDFVVEISDAALKEPVEAEWAWQETRAGWSERAKGIEETAAPRDVGQAICVLRGLTRPGGGMVAAATLSLPERAEEGRNYDYRYAWIRDQCYAGIAAASLGGHRLVGDAVSFVSSRLLEDGPQLRPAYTATGGSVPEESTVRGLRGYPGGGNKVGNQVSGQFQLDCFGEALQLFSAAARTGELTDDARQAALVCVRAIKKRYDEPESGIWELEAKWWAHSRLSCVAGLKTAAANGDLFDKGEAAEVEALADSLLAAVARSCTHSSGRWQRSPEDERVDAALVLPPVRGAVSPGDPRTASTLAAVEEELCREGYVYRFRQDERPLDQAEGSFLLCGFMVCLAELDQDEVVKATSFFERTRSGSGTSGIFSEEYDVRQRQLRGNVPQAFVHAMLLECAVALGRRI